MIAERQSILDKVAALACPAGSLGDTWDAIVIGAGPAGCTAALQLARSGARTLLVERQTFPRHKICGCCLSAASLSLIAQNNLAPVIEQVANDLTALRVYSGESMVTIDLPAGKAVSRRFLDSALAVSAMEAGTVFCHGISATVLNIAGNHRLVKLCSPENSIVRASVVVAADGLAGACLQRVPELSTVEAPGTMIGAGTVVAFAPPFFRDGVIYMGCANDGYIGAVRLEDGSLDMAAAFDQGFLKSYHTPALAAEALLLQSGLPAVDSLEQLAWRGTVQLTRQRSNLAAERIFVIGDAAGYVEPFTGEGIAWAIASGLRVAPMAIKAIDGWQDELQTTWNDRYKQEMSHKQAPCRAVSAVLKNRWLREMSVSALCHMPVLAQPLVKYIQAIDTKAVHPWH